ncbi:hypothetical protein [Amycolatopsis sp. DSM 110486]|uniref:hypothetical protein n=1 Tax=Amycolatopsis sp. DSM 110486 TaxID=2865832 RepID=UPI001C6A47B5|nr:hypothetical protein [Amycolatopsis sp. DSM 110486]QYN17477.1 hypothetical protein K1T34_32345 [Amycolatopsis sp. DSM 110486]
MTRLLLVPDQTTRDTCDDQLTRWLPRAPRLLVSFWPEAGPELPPGAGVPTTPHLEAFHG